MTRRVRPGPRRGHDERPVDRLRPVGWRRRGRPARVRAALSGAGRRPARSGGDLGRPARDGPRGDRRGRRGGADRGDRCHEPARDRRRLGAGERSRRSPTRSSGRAASRHRSARSFARRGHETFVRAKHRPSDRRLLQRPEDPPDPARGSVAPAARRARRARRRDGRVVPDLAADRRPRPRDRRLERVADAPPRHPDRGAWDDDLLDADGGARARSCRRSAARRRSTARPIRRSSAGRSRSPARPATSRRRRSARPASRPGEAKVTLGTGAFLLANTGATPVGSRSTACSRPSPGGSGPARRSSTPSRARSSSRARPSSGCATGSACSATSADVEALAVSRRRQRRGRRRAGVRRARRAVLGSATPAARSSA